MAQSSYNTNLASEFYVMSVLYRLGLDANLTLSNRKAVDIVVVRAPGDTITIDVKAVAGKVDWLVGSRLGTPRERHFVVLLTYEAKFKDVNETPNVWVLPHEEFLGLIEGAKPPSKMLYVRRSRVRKLENRKAAWHLLATPQNVTQPHHQHHPL